MIGREKERQELLEAYRSEYSEFVAVYGRRRIGKTYLVRETFNYKFTFEHAGNSHAPMTQQLESWLVSLRNCGWKGDKVPSTWIEAFSMLNDLIKKSKAKKKVVFIDEMPWMDTPHSFFVSALEYFWNNLASARRDVLLIICGSATSWIINKVIKNHGGLHNRVTYQISLQPFNLHECEEYLQSKQMDISKYDIILGYMAFGGVPYYWSLMQKGESIGQNIDRLIFNPSGRLHEEFSELYDSLFRSPEDYIRVVTTLGEKKAGMTREEIIHVGKLSNNGKLTRILQDLEFCGFIRQYRGVSAEKSKFIFQLMDNYTLFYFKFVKNNKGNDPHYWMHSIGSATYNAWSGIAFERVCYHHIPQIKRALGISGVVTNVFSWRADNETQKHGAQIDMIIDRADNVVNLCEMKFADATFSVTKAIDTNLRNKIARLRDLLPKRKTISVVLVTTFGLAHNAYASIIANCITMDDLFSEE